MSNNLICFGDVVKLSAKSAFVDSDADTNFLGFLEQKKEMLLVVAPVKDELKDKFVEAEFVIAPVRGDKPPLPGTPLNYKQPFVLKTSDGSGYSLNNKTPNMTEVVSLREMGIKGEMYVAIQKEGFGEETHVHDNDMGIELHVVDSNRIRKTYDNVALKHFVKSKSDAPGGFVTCSQKKAQVLNLKIVKAGDKKETRAFIKDPVFRRASQMLLDPKADETSEASVLESPSRAGSIVTTGPLVLESPVVSAPSSPTAATATEPKVETPETEAAAEPVATTTTAPVVEATPPSAATTVATTSVETTPEAPATVTTTPTTNGVDPAALTAQLLQSMEPAAMETPAKPVDTTSVVGEEMQTALATIELSAAAVTETDNVHGSVPVHDKLPVPVHHEQPVKTTDATESVAKGPSVTSDVSELETLTGLPSVPEEHLETACAGKCAIM